MNNLHSNLNLAFLQTFLHDEDNELFGRVNRFCQLLPPSENKVILSYWQDTVLSRSWDGLFCSELTLSCYFPFFFDALEKVEPTEITEN